MDNLDFITNIFNNIDLSNSAKLGIVVTLLTVVLVLYFGLSSKSTPTPPAKLQAINTSLPKQVFMQTDPSGNISTFDFATTPLNSDVSINGNFAGSGSNITGDSTVTGKLTAGGLNITNGWKQLESATSAEISNDTGTYKQLMILGNKSKDGSRRTGVWDHLDVNGTLTANSIVVAGGKAIKIGDWTLDASDGHLRFFYGDRDQHFVLHNSTQGSRPWSKETGYFTDKFVKTDNDVYVKRGQSYWLAGNRGLVKNWNNKCNSGDDARDIGIECRGESTGDPYAWKFV